jgi:hypothetical protein
MLSGNKEFININIIGHDLVHDRAIWAGARYHTAPAQPITVPAQNAGAALSLSKGIA